MTQDLGSDAEEAEMVLRSIDLGPNFSRCVDKWKEFEMCATVREGRLPSSNRLSALSELKKKDLVALPCLSKASQRALIDETLQWWNSIQPESRQSSSPSHAQQLPIADFTGDMGKLRKKRRSGIVQILYLVQWWGTLVRDGNHDPALWNAFTQDVTSCLLTMLEGAYTAENSGGKRPNEKSDDVDSHAKRTRNK
ncbi:hypothetical protein EV421DRAFT_1897952 [Armillaria borealis]|uniref:Uncharacterized protein n=1 Tax=Armillaria borealis TaxID=47425 RepID=A0AA39N1F2_9AGAR|nr:hypothetical protein EV421DRAFT_1897952 [Armillaria borealis]